MSNEHSSAKNSMMASRSWALNASAIAFSVSANTDKGLTITFPPSGGPHALPLQLLLQLVEEAPVGAPGDELLGARLDHPGLMETQSVKPERIVGVPQSPLVV